MKESYIKLDSNEIARSYSKDYIKELLITKGFNDFDVSRYPDSASRDLIKAYSIYSKINENNLIQGNGSDEILDMIFSVYGKNKKVVTMDPDFSMYDIYSKKYNSKLFKARCKNIDDLLDFSREENPDMIILSNPNNPTGRGFEISEIENLIKGFEKMVVVDEAYFEFYRQSACFLVNNFKNLIITRTCSKGIGMAGLRIGFGVSCEENIDKLREVRQPYNIGRLNQVLGSLILREGSLIEKNINEVIKNRDVFYNRLEKIAKNVRGFEVLKSKANFLYIETRRGESIYEFLLKSNIKVRLFESGLRITVGKMDENLEVAKKLEEYFEMEEICDLAI